ncbi:MAG: hypothetical protein LBL75_03785 [Rickettsiales bacterium]|jgi:GH24 family phage-related lysozyme (muramidase)|nr:hypothetical protein [Rickettsiales bacterium]
MNLNELILHLKNSGLNVLNANADYILLEDPTCFVRDLSNFLDVAWLIITIMAGILLFGWGIALIRRAGGEIVNNLRNLFLIMAILSCSRVIINAVWGGDLFNVGCRTIRIPTANIERAIGATELKLKARPDNQLFEEIHITDSDYDDAVAFLGEINVATDDGSGDGQQNTNQNTNVVVLSENTATETTTPEPAPVPKPVAIVDAVLPFGSLADFLLKHEGYRTQVYLDTKYFPTVGIGSLVKDYSRFAPFDFFANGRKLTDSQKREYHSYILNFARDAKSRRDPMVRSASRNSIRSGTLSDGTRVADIQTTRESIINEVNRYTENSISYQKKKYKNWDAFPRSAKTAILDYAYNWGDGWATRLRTLDNCIRKMDWNCAANATNIGEGTQSRKAARRDLFLNASKGN